MMKKSLLVLAIGALCSLTASANFYVQGDLGVAKTKFSSYPEMNKTNIAPSVSVGYDLGAMRLALDYTHYGKFSGTSYFGVNQKEHVSAKIYGLGLSAFYDFNVNSALKPYLGMRLASNIFDIENKGSNFFRSEKTTKLGYGFIAGAQYGLTTNLFVNGGIEYNRLGRFSDTSVNQYGAKVGLRYDF